MPRSGWYDSYHQTKFHPGTGVFVRCHWCNNCFSNTLQSCPDCGTIKDTTQGVKAQARAEMGFLDHIRVTARKEGKDPKAAVRKIRSIQRYGYVTEQGSRELNRKLIAYIKKPHVSGRMFFARPYEKFCMDCGSSFTAHIRGNRYGGQKRCRKCQDYANREREVNWQRRHYIKKDRPPL